MSEGENRGTLKSKRNHWIFMPLQIVVSIVLRKYNSLTWKDLQDILPIYFNMIFEIFVAFIH